MCIHTGICVEVQYLRMSAVSTYECSMYVRMCAVYSLSAPHTMDTYHEYLCEQIHVYECYARKLGIYMHTYVHTKSCNMYNNNLVQ